VTEQAPTGARSEPQASEVAVQASLWLATRPRKPQASEAVVRAGFARRRTHN
jgi:hypothetical protein